MPQVYEKLPDIPAEIDIEFGFTVNIKNARGSKIRYCIEHPGIYDDAGKVHAPFSGEVHITNNDWDFYLGDTIWAPIEDKCGPWRMTIELNNNIIADKTFNISSDNSSPQFKKRFAYI